MKRMKRLVIVTVMLSMPVMISACVSLPEPEEK